MNAIAAVLERSTKLVLFVSMVAAAAVGAWYGAPGWNHFFAECVIAFVGAFVLGKVVGDGVLFGALAVLYVLPSLISELHGEYYFQFNVIWTSWVLGSLLARADVRRWHVPPKWRLPIGFWALILAVAWPIVAARECDFHFSLLHVEHIGNSRNGGLPWYEVAWVVNVTTIIGVGLLTFDWLFETFEPENVPRFRVRVLMPLAAGILVASAVALYQGFVDITFLSGGHWSTHQRAPGTLLDGDAFGALAGWWTIGFAAIAVSTAPRAMRLLSACGYVLSWGAVWASGSRMALASALLGAIVFIPFLAGTVIAARARHGVRLVAPVAVAVALLLVFAAYAPWTTASPVRRAVTALPTYMTGGPRAVFVNIFWNRGAPYGTAWVQMVEDSPLVGVGAGAFHILFPDYAYLIDGRRSEPDNAQSWYRHQLAEYGIVGSLGWIAWLFSVGGLLITARARSGSESEARLVRTALVAIALVSAVSMPGQHIADAFTIVVLTFWFVRLVDTQALDRPMLPRMAPRVAFGTAWALALFFVVVSAFVGWTKLRPPMRAARGNWGYAYGFYEPEQVDGRTSQWAARNAVAVVLAPKPWLRIDYWANHADIASHPVQVKIWCDRDRVVRATLRSGTPETIYWRVPEASKRVMIETSVDHVVRPRDLGLPDDRELGLAVSWTFVDAPPAAQGATD